ncbi:MAG: ChbG/HpnK family deacetylase [Solirubrobacteraceae bacterium]
MISPPGSGLLIVNADDLGYDAAATDAILAAHAAGAITSATAMVWMRDSERAGALARDSPLALGLHLNLIEPYTAPDVPAAVAATQRRVVERIHTAGSRAFAYHPGWASDFRRCIADQLACFEQTYGQAPTHVDGHQHMHLLPNALFSGALAPVPRCRRPVNRPETESRPYKHALRDVQAAMVRLRFASTRWCFSIRALEPALGGAGIEAGIGRAAADAVEIMVHPGWADEQTILLGDHWRAIVSGQRLGSFAELASR